MAKTYNFIDDLQDVMRHQFVDICIYGVSISRLDKESGLITIYDPIHDAEEYNKILDKSEKKQGIINEESSN